MNSLLDIAVTSAPVAVGDVVVSTYGLSAGSIASLMGRFEPVQRLMAGDQVDSAAIMALGNEIVGAIIAAGTGYPGDANAERHAQRLPVGVQLDLIAAILRQTMPGGFGPLVEKVSALGLMLSANESKPAPSSASVNGYASSHPAGSPDSSQLYSNC